MPACDTTKSTRAIWLVCIGIALLFLARGAFQPYFFKLFENLGGALTYAQIALLLNGYVLAQSLCAPLAGWYTDRTSVRVALTTSIVLGLISFMVISTGPGFVVSTLAILAAGVAFIQGKIALNTLLVRHSSAEILRRSVAKRATLLNLGSFCGNSIANQMITHVGYSAHTVLVALLYLPLAIGLAAPSAPSVPTPRRSPWGMAKVRSLCHNRGFIADALRRFAVVLPYGCWGTIIPKYITDRYQSIGPVWIVYLTSLCTTIVGAHFLAVYLSGKLYRRGFKWEWWSMTSVFCYCTGLLLLMFVPHPVMLPVAIVVFISGEVLMTPCFDETAKKHSGDTAMGTCMGLLHLVDGLGRLFGSAFTLAVYGWMRNSAYNQWFWPLVVCVFLVVCTLINIVAHILTPRAESHPCHEQEN